MKIGILGSGAVGQALARGYARHGHDVLIGTRKSEVEGLPVGSADQAVADADIVMLAVAGRASVEVTGSGADHVIAFDRGGVVPVATRLPAAVMTRATNTR